MWECVRRPRPVHPRARVFLCCNRPLLTARVAHMLAVSYRPDIVVARARLRRWSRRCSNQPLPTRELVRGVRETARENARPEAGLRESLGESGQRVYRRVPEEPTEGRALRWLVCARAVL
jgi:hypothetical protein